MSFHELGHLLAALAAGIKVNEFSLGFGPRLLSFRRKGIQYSIRLIPLWAYAALEAEHTDPPGMGFNEQGVLKRMGVVAAGPGASLALAVLAFTILFSVVGALQPTTVVAELIADYPAQRAGIKPGDRIVAIDGNPVVFWDDITRIVGASAGREVEVTVERSGSRLGLRMVPTIGEAGRGMIGVRPTFEVFRDPLPRGIRRAVVQTFVISRAWVQGILAALLGRAPLEPIGPVGIGQIIGEASRSGAADVLALIGMISATLGLMNLLPIPALDGSRLVFLLIEAVRGRPIDPEKENLIQSIGFAILLALGILVTFKDIQRLMV